MPPNSLSAELVAIGGCAGVAVLTAWAWDRLRRRWWGWALHAVSVLGCVAISLGVAGIAVNRELNLYTSWAQLLGLGTGAPPAGYPSVVSKGQAGSRVVAFEVPGQASGIGLPAYAYLPPGYDSAAGRRTRYPVIEAVDGYPGSPYVWLRALDAATYLDREILAGRMAPTVVVFPYQYTDPTHDGECVNAVGGQQWDTFLTADVRAAAVAQFRVRGDRAGWGIIGTSTGGFCAANLAMRHPDRYAAAASLSGYFTALTDRTTGDLYRGDLKLREENSPLWRVRNLPVPDLPLYLAASRDDHSAYGQLRRFAAAVRPPIGLDIVIVPQGGHTDAAWKVMEPSAFDWLSSWLAAAGGAPTGGPGASGHPAAAGDIQRSAGETSGSVVSHRR